MTTRAVCVRPRHALLVVGVAFVLAGAGMRGNPGPAHDSTSGTWGWLGAIALVIVAVLARALRVRRQRRAVRADAGGGVAP